MIKQEPFYRKFIKNQNRIQPEIAQKADKKKHRKQEADYNDTGNNSVLRDEKQPLHFVTSKKSVKSRRQTRHIATEITRLQDACNFGMPVFSDLNPEAKNILEHFPDILARVLPLDSKKKQSLPQHIHDLFHELTDERCSRKVHYLNNPVKLSAYTHYYVWWNLVRLTKLLQNIDILLDDGDYAADFGSGPLTFVCALWIAKPELRKKNITWYCVDISNKALNFGEELFLAMCAYSEQITATGAAAWKIKKICGSFGTPLNEKLAFFSEANMFNEIFWDSRLSLDEQAKKAQKLIASYLTPQGTVLLVEPGIPLAGEFVSLMRDLFIQKGFSVSAPCPHEGGCCFPNRKPASKNMQTPAAHNKWCHFTFETTDSPKNLLRLSDLAKLGKERASLSFLYCSATPLQVFAAGTGKSASYSALVAKGLPVRICSDIIRLESQRIGRYACSAKGFLFLIGSAYKESVLNTAISGTLLILPDKALPLYERDKKTGALLICLD